ncbi:MAG: DUF4434 domain-containing protein [Phycisphaerales bacterium]
MSAATDPIVTGAFIQLNGGITSNSQQWWDNELRAMHDIGMDTVVLQYVGYGASYYYPSSLPGVSGSGTDAVGRVMQAADTLGMDVYLGLQLNTGSFNLNQSLTRGLATLAELDSRYGGHTSLAGWYVPEEISDQIVFSDPTLRDDLVSYIGQISQQAHVDTSLPVMISPYFGQSPDVNAYANWWDTTGLPGTGIDILAMQDGVGTHRTTIAESLPVYQALAPVAQSHGVSFWANNENFNQTHGWPVDEQPWAAEPTDITTFTAQIASTAPYVDKAITFEFSHYMSPQASPQADTLYQDYADFLGAAANGNPIPVAGYVYENPSATTFHASATDPANSLLTDGFEGSLADGPGSAFANGTWVGFVNNDAQGGPQPRVVLDLDGTQNVGVVEVFYLVSASPFIFAPQPVPGVADAMTIEVSGDGVIFSPVASSNDFATVAEDQSASAFEVRSVVFDLGGISASYLALDVRTPYTYTFLGEIKVFEAHLPGDLDGDGFVGIADLNLVLGYWNQGAPLADPRADPSADGFVGIEDLNLVLGNWNTGTPPASVVPEPAVSVIFVMALARWAAARPVSQPRNGRPMKTAGVRGTYVG